MELLNKTTTKNPFVRLFTTAVFFSISLSVFAEDQVDPIGRFEITRFEVEGNTLLTQRAVDLLLEPYAGKSRDFGDVQRALEALEQAYQLRGYNVVRVILPEQELNHGVVRFKVMEARLGKITIEGNKHFDETNIRHSMPGLRVGVTPNIANISSSLKLANENPSKKTNLQLQSAENEGEIYATVKVTDEKPWRVGLTLDNTGTDSSGKTHIGVSYQNDNIANLDHVLSLQYTTTTEKPSQVSVYGVGYHIPLYSVGDSIDLFGSYSDVDSGTIAAGIFNLQVSGKGSVYGARYNHNLTRIGNYESKLIYGADYKQFKNNIGLLGTQLGNDVTVHPLNLTYSGSWALSSGEAGFYVTGLRNVPGGDQGDGAAFNRVRANASSSYSLLRYGANYLRGFASDWQMRLVLNGQYTHDLLVPGEQFGAGGAGSVRGFLEREIASDTGNFASAEIYTPSFCSGVTWAPSQCRFLAFYDNAYVSRNKPLPGETGQESIGSAGLGFRMSIDRYMSMQMDYGYVLDAGGAQSKGDRRVHFRMGLTY